MREHWKNFLQSRASLALLLAVLVVACVGAVFTSARNHMSQVGYEEAAVSESASEGADGTEESDAVAQAGADAAQTEESGEDVAANAGAVAESALSFTADSRMSWPVDGEIVLDYSMDSTTYFPTLEVYKCNPAVLIQGQAGDAVRAPRDCKVSEVGTDDEIGNYVVLDLGDSCQVTLGQLDKIEVAEGDLPQEGDILACLAEPTRYYTVEGTNLYMSMTVDGEYADPVDYLQ